MFCDGGAQAKILYGRRANEAILQGNTAFLIVMAILVLLEEARRSDSMVRAVFRALRFEPDWWPRNLSLYFGSGIQGNIQFSLSFPVVGRAKLPPSN
jgi:hypothetical protein